MRKLIIIYFLIFGINAKASCDEFLYPVDKIFHEGREKICVIHQTKEHLELWFWDPNTKIATNGLLSSYTPSGLSVLPSKQSFSFIDNDRIKIKHLNKRSAKVVDFFGPYYLTTLSWIDDNNFYFWAHENKKFSMFGANVNGDIYRLSDENSSYPYKIENRLFYVENNDMNFNIKVKDYPVDFINTLDKKYISPIELLEKEDSESEIQSIKIKTIYKDKSEIIFSCKKAISFLQMIDENNGFFLTSQKEISKTDEFIEFDFQSLQKKDNVWNIKIEFNFKLPLNLLISNSNSTRLYESILPLLVRIINSNLMYFSSYDQETKSLNLFSYHNNEITKITNETSNENLIFPAFVFNEKIFYGGSCNKIEDGPNLSITENGDYLIDLPSIK